MKVKSQSEKNRAKIIDNIALRSRSKITEIGLKIKGSNMMTSAPYFFRVNARAHHHKLLVRDCLGNFNLFLDWHIFLGSFIRPVGDD